MTPALLLAAAVVLASCGDVLLSRGMRGVGEVRLQRPADLLALAGQALRQRDVRIGIACMAAYFGCYIVSLAQLDVSLANPLTALSMVCSCAYAVAVLRERIPPERWLGIALVVIGAAFIGRSG